MRTLLESYLAEEPNAEYREQIRQLRPDEVQNRLEGSWRFGTAGFRAPMQAGYLRMNRVSVAKIAHSLGVFLKPKSRVVVGFDARHHSEEHAQLVSEVLSAQGHEVYLFSRIVPTPLCSFAIGELNSHAGVMVTASHNPPQDNGIKIYGPHGAQLVGPETHEIESWLKQAPAYTEIARASLGIHAVSEQVIEAYFKTIVSDTSALPAPISIIYTPIHGVGTLFAVEAFKRRGIEEITLVESQSQPDGHFPTVKFPNPEEEGTLDEAMRLSREHSADIVLANDPDADRLAVCINQKILTGNEIGILLANHLIQTRAHKLKKPLVMTTLVSSRMLSKIAKSNNVHYAETQTGFANIVHEAMRREKELGEEFLFGYEEALGYCIGNRIRDKDGISAAVLFAELVSVLKSQNRTVFDQIDELSVTHGLHRGLSWSLRDTGYDVPKSLQKQTSSVAGLEVYTGEHNLKLMIRPSGTEPKIKFYAEAIEYPRDLSELKELTKVLDTFLQGLKTQMGAL